MKLIYWKAWSADGNNVFEGNMMVDKIGRSFEGRDELERLVRTHLELTKNGIAIKQVVICNIMDI